MSAPFSDHIIVVGGGIVGLAVAREILLQSASNRVTVLEKEPQIALHQSGRNSGVIHSGIYYPPGTKKAILCREGIHLLHQFCDEHSIYRNRCGKVIVAVKESEISALEKLYERAVANGISDARLISREELREIEPEVKGLQALHLPDVAVVNFQIVASRIRHDVELMGGVVLCNRQVRAIRCKEQNVEVETPQEVFRARYLVNCAGLYSDRIARMAKCKIPVRIIPFRGSYYVLISKWKRKIRGLIYPVPDQRFPFLGIHLTPVVTREIMVGPNAVLAFSREGYRWFNIQLGDILDFALYSGFWMMGLKYWQTGLLEIMQAGIKPLYLRALRRLVPGIQGEDLRPDISGVRAQAVDRSGNLVDDFFYVQQAQAIHILNAPSPAATASLAIAKEIVGLIPKV